MGKTIVLYVIPLILPCSASKCNIPFLRDYVQDNGKNRCEFIVRDCRMLETSGRIGHDFSVEKELEIFQIVSIFIVSFLLPLIFIATIADLTHRYSSWKLLQNYFWNSLMTWSVCENFKSLLKSKGGTFPFLNGIRVLCAYWVLLGHTFYFPVALVIENDKGINMIKELRKSIAWTPVENFTLSVDTFFFISGFLLFHSAWAEMYRNDGRMNIPVFLLRKYWRLTKGTIVLMISATMFYLLRSDLCFYFVVQVFFKNACSCFLWKNLLFIQNYWSSMEMCGPHTWYLAVLFQYHILGVFLICLIYWNRNIGIVAGTIIVIICNVITYTILNHNIHIFEEALKNERFYLMKLQNCRKIVYRLPFDHFGPYWFGITTGWLLKNRHYCILKKKYHLGAWIMSITCLVSAVFSCHLQNTTSYCFIYESLHRTIWGIGLVWVVYECANGSGGILDKFLSWRPFLFLGDLTFFFYLVHPFIVLKDCCQHSGNYPFQVPYWICRSVVSTAISFCIAFFFHVALERPIFQWKSPARHLKS